MLSPEELQFMRGKTFPPVMSPDEHGCQYNTCNEEPRLSYIVRSGINDEPEERWWLVDEVPVGALSEAIAKLIESPSVEIIPPLNNPKKLRREPGTWEA